MYNFEAYYINMDNDDVLSRQIEFDGQFLGSEEECYIYAMKQAYALKQPNELLSNLEFISC